MISSFFYFHLVLRRFGHMHVKVSRRLDLVYGGGSIGLMGLVSQAVHRGGGKVIGYSY